MQPRRELSLPAELLDPLAEFRKGLLRRILRVLGIREQVPRQPLDARRMPRAKRLEGASVAVLGPRDQDRIAETVVEDRRLGPKLTLDSTAVTRDGLHGGA
jgi:hypothetical protein